VNTAIPVKRSKRYLALLVYDFGLPPQQRFDPAQLPESYGRRRDAAMVAVFIAALHKAHENANCGFIQAAPGFWLIAS
jgi:hypothetical protein